MTLWNYCGWICCQVRKAGTELDDDVVDVDLLIETCLDREGSAANLLLVSFSSNDTTDVAKEIEEKGRLRKI